MTLLRKEKSKFYNNLNPKCLSDDRLFWKSMKPFFSEKSIKTSKIVLVENNDILHDDKQAAETLNSFFSNAVKNLGLQDNYHVAVNDNDNDQAIILKINERYVHHPSIEIILSHYGDDAVIVI